MPTVLLRPSLLGYALMAAALLVAGCGTAGPFPAQHPPRPGHKSSSAGHVHQPVVRTERDGSNGRTVHVKPGDRIELVLGSDYWVIRASSAPAVLRQDGPSRTLAPVRSCPPGVGCRPLRTLFAALSPGTAVITAHRRTCGEALRCVGSQGRFRLTVVVRRR
jgi:hypothetical protein